MMTQYKLLLSTKMYFRKMQSLIWWSLKLGFKKDVTYWIFFLIWWFSIVYKRNIWYLKEIRGRRDPLDWRVQEGFGEQVALELSLQCGVTIWSQWKTKMLFLVESMHSRGEKQSKTYSMLCGKESRPEHIWGLFLELMGHQREDGNRIHLIFWVYGDLTLPCGQISWKFLRHRSHLMAFKFEK